jgi:hypothetical protein
MTQVAEPLAVNERTVYGTADAREQKKRAKDEPENEETA